MKIESRPVTSGVKYFIDYRFNIYYASPVSISAVNRVNDRFKMLFIAEGSCILNTVNKRIVLISPALVLLDENTEANIIEKEKLAVRLLVFHPDFINTKFDFRNIRKAENPFSFSERQDIFLFEVFAKNGLQVVNTVESNAADKITGYFNALETILRDQKHDCWPCQARCCLIGLLFYVKTVVDYAKNIRWINEIVFNKKTEANGRPDVNKILVYLNTHYDEKISVERLAALFHTNRTTLSQCFKEATGLSIYNYLLKTRIQIASSLLQNTVLKVYEIMAKVGFADATNFMRSFRKYTGQTPLHFRKVNTWIKK